jgi:cation diffusion facilitator family transporter
MAELSAAAAKRRVALSSILGAVFITALKLVAGLWTGSLGILSEAAHSGLDLLAAGITYVSVRVSDRPADQSHPYGHQKIENFSAFLEIGFLLLTCLWIVYEAARRLLGRPFAVDATPAAFAVMAISIAVDFLRSRALTKAAREYGSQALEADALHFSTDIWSSAVVILGLVLVRLGAYLHMPELQKADPVAALGVAVIVFSVSLRLGKKAAEALLDAAPAGLAERIEHVLSQVEGVTAVERVRTRHAGNQYFVDVNIAVARNAPLEHAKSVADAARNAIHTLLPGADVMIHTEPRAAGVETLFDTVKLVAARRRLSVHDLSAYDTGKGVALEFHLEVGEALSLESAHRMVSELEAEIQREAPEVATINTHIENEGAQIRHSALNPEEAAAWREPLMAVASSFPEVLDCHDVTVFGPGDRPSISCHCVFRGEMPVYRVHEITSQIENRFRQRYPQIHRLTIHPEPHSVLDHGKSSDPRPVAGVEQSSS